MLDKKIINRFNYIKKLINNENDNKILIDNQFYFNEKAYNYISKINKQDFFLNSYYNLTNLDILLMIYENKNITSVKKQLLSEYKENYAKAIFENFIYILEVA